MKKKLFLLLPLLLLSGCSKTISNAEEEPTEKDAQTYTETETGEQSETGGGEGGQQENPPIVGRDDYDYDLPTNTPFSLNDYENFYFHDGREPEYNQYWNYYYGDSYSPNGELWKNPNEKLDYSGIEFLKNSFIVSPKFECWNKLEIRFEFWFSYHSSSKYNAVKNAPQFLLELYDQTEKKLETVSIYISKEDVPTGTTSKTFKEYVFQPTCNHFILRWNNYVPNSQGGYSAILVSSTIKGFPYTK